MKSHRPRQIANTAPQLGLVCITSDTTIRYRTTTRALYLKLGEAERISLLRAIYRHNFEQLLRTLEYLDRHAIRLYRMPNDVLPLSDEAEAGAVLDELSDALPMIGDRARDLGIRLLAHPDQYVVLSSEKPTVVATSIHLLQRQARLFDRMGLEASPWNPLIVHGGKSGRGDALVQVIRALPTNVKQRLVLENDEYAYSAAEILDVSRRADVPMVFDNLHHAVHEALEDHDDPSFAAMVAAAATTWPNPTQQIVHLSNGESGPLDARHSQLITHFPRCYRTVPWIEVEAKGKEQAIFALRKLLGA